MQEIRVTCAADFVPLACLMIGYLPEQAVVLLPQDPDRPSLSDARPVAAFPLDGAAQEAGEALLRYAEVFGTGPMMAVVFGGDELRALVSVLLQVVWADDLSAVEMVRFEDGLVFESFDADEVGTALDLQSHPITLASIELGTQLRSRREMAALWTIGAGEAGLGAQIAAEAARTLHVWESSSPDREALQAFAVPVGAALLSAAQGIEDRRRLPSLVSAEEAAQFLAAAVVIPVRDELLAVMARNRALGRELSQLWAAVGNSVTAEQGGADAMVLAAFAAYLGGKGTEANLALDAALAVDRDHSLGQLLEKSIRFAMPPHVLSELLISATKE